jgi:hypothetical protein
MASMNPAYTDGTYDPTLDVRERTGGPRRPRHSAAPSRDFYERFASNTPTGSHMPLDTEMHWEWSNPLNILPAFVALLFLITLVALIVG